MPRRVPSRIPLISRPFFAPIASLLALVAVFALAAPVAAAPTLGPGGPLPLTFEPNVGQADASVKFLARGRGYGLFLTPNETVFVLVPTERSADGRRPQPRTSSTPPPSVVRMRLVGADPQAAISGIDPRPSRSHYLIGEPSRWRQDVPTFGRVRYQDVYPGISLLFYGSERHIEYDFVVEPGADPAAVVLTFDGARDVRLDGTGDLVLTTAAGELRLRRPVIYQETEGKRQPIEGGFVLDGDRVRFRVVAWDASRPLVIDPVLGYSTYLGGASNDEGLGIAVDAAGNAYVTGTTISADFPVSSLPAGTRGGVTDAFVAKLDPTGTTLLYSTYLGGSGDDIGNAIAVDVNGNAYVAGSTTSSNFPVLVAFQGTNRGLSDAFVTKLNPSGSALVYATYLGGNGLDFAFGIAVDALGNAYVTGSTASAAFPNNGALTCLGTKSTGNDAFVAKVAPSGGTLGYCRFIGGSGDDSGQAITADAFGNVWVAGSTTSNNIQPQSAFQSTFGGQTDAFLSRLDTNGALVYLTYLGGNGDDLAFGVAVDAAGNAYVTGSTSSTNFPTASPLQSTPGGGDDVFVTKLNPAGTGLVFSTYLGGSGDDVGNGIGVHPVDSSVYVTGATGSVDFPTVSALQTTLGGGLDAFVTKLNASGATLVYSTFLGGTGDDMGQAIAVDPDGVAFLTGSTSSPAFPTVAPIQNATGLLDAFVTQIADGGVIQFSGATYSVNENAGSIVIAVQRTGDSSGAATVEFRTSDGTATAGADYTAVSTVLTFGPGQVVATATVTVLDDTAGDGDETVTLTLQNPTGGAVLGARHTATLTIVDDEPAINFSTATYSVTENHGPAVITVTRSGPVGGTVTVQFSTADGSATAPTDYTVVNRTLTFGPGVRTATVSVPIINDTLAEGTETVTLSLSNVAGGTPPALLGVRNTAVLNIVDDDVAGSVQFSKATYSVSEAAGVATITVTRTGGTASGVTVDYATSDGKASAGADYTPTTGTLTFGAGTTSVSFTVPIVNDTSAEGDETVNLTLTNPGGGASLGSQNTAVLTIVDDEPTISFSTDSFTVAESAPTAVITVRRGGVATGAVAVDYSTTDGSAQSGVDYTATAGTLSFASGVTTKTFTVPILNDTRVTAARTVILSLGNPTGSITIVTPSTATLTITDDDVAGIIEFGAPVFDIAENAGSAIITVARRNGTAGGATVNFTTSDGTATAGSDYTFSGGTLTFGVGETSKTFAVPILNDGLAEGVETVNLTLSTPGGGATLGARTTALLRIIDDEKALGFSAQSYTVNEGAGTATITVELTGVSTTDTITVNYATSNGTATAGLDYTTATGTLIFPPGGTATGIRTKTFTVPILQDTLAEGTETINLTLSMPTPVGVAQLVTARSTAILSIEDDDEGGAIEFDGANFSALESAGTGVIRVKRTGTAGKTLASGVTIDYATSDGTATAGLDYVATAGRLTFPAGATSLTFTVPLINDTLGEGKETVNLTLSNPGGGGTIGGTANAVLDILDDEPNVSLSAATYTVSEGAGFLTVTVVRGGVDTATLTVDFATVDQFPAGTGKAVANVDYTAVMGTLTFPPTVRARTFTIPILNDSVPEPDEKFDVVLRNAQISAGTVTIVTPARAEVTITDDDLGGMIQFSALTYSVNEDGGSANVTVVRTGGQAGGVSARLQTGDLFAVTPPLDPQTATAADYTSTDVRVTFGPGETTRIVRIPITVDATAEGIETLYVQLSDPQPGSAPGTPTIGQMALATVSIADAQPTVQFGQATFTIAEGQPVATVTVQRTAPGGRLTVDYATTNGTATAPADYLTTAGTLTFDAGVTSQSFTVRLVDNQVVAPDKNFNVTLSSLQPPAASTLGPRTTASVLIKENDRGGTFTVFGGAVNEHDGVFNVTISRTGGTGGPVSVEFSARECGVLAASCDFAARETADPTDPVTLPRHFVPIASQTLTFLPGEISKTVQVTIVDNAVAEGSRNFAVSIRNPQPSVMQDLQQIGASIGTPDALVNIAEDELYFVFLSSENYAAQESTGEAFITVVRSGLPGFLAQSLTLDMMAVTGGDNPAVPGQDFVDLGGGLVARDSAFTFAPNQTTKTFRVPFLNDTVVDGPKTMVVFIADCPGSPCTPKSPNPRNTDPARGPGIAFPGAATLTIQDDDIGGTIQFGSTVYSVPQDVASGMATITLTRTGGLASGVTVRAQTGDLFTATTPPQTGAAGVDYTSTNTTVTFNAGDTSAVFNVPILNDAGAPSGVKTVNLQIDTPLPGGTGASPNVGPASKALLRIIDSTQTVGFTLANFDVSEAAGTATVQLERTGDISGSLTVNYATTDGTAMAGVHYQATTGTVTFSGNQAVASFTVPIIDNKVVAVDKVLNLSLSAPSVGTVVNAATLTIKDDDVAGAIGFGSPVFLASESGGSAEVTIVRTGGTAGCPSPLVGLPPSCPDATRVTIVVSDGSALAGSDYTAPTGTTVEFGAGEFAKTVLIPITFSAVIEGTETINLALTTPEPAGFAPRSPTLSLASATVQLLETQFRVAATSLTVGEASGQVTVTVVREGDLSNTATLDYVTVDNSATSGSGSDFVSVTGGRLTFDPNVAVLTFDVLVREDGVVEGDERFDIVFSNPVGAGIARESCATATPAAPALVANCTINIAVLDNDFGGLLSFSQAIYDVNENAASATITVRRVGGTADAVTVDFATSDGTATNGVDYDATTQTLTFGLGETLKTVAVPLRNGTVGVRSVNLALRNATGGGLVASPGGAAVLRISDVDNSVGFAFLGFAVNENVGVVPVTIRRTGTSGQVTVQFATTPGSAVAPNDYATVNTTVTFAAGVTTATVMVPIVGDALVESNETLTLTLSNPTGASIAPDLCLVATPTTCTAALTIIDDDQGGVIQLSSATYSVAETGGSATITLTRAGGLAGGVTVAFNATPGSAAPGDFSLPSGTVTFLAGQASATATVNVNDNLLADGDRTVNLSISTPQPAGLPGSPILGLRTSAVLTIRDNEPRVQFSAPTFSVAEGAPTAVMTVTRTGDTSVPVLLDYASTGGSATAGADYTIASGTVTFGVGITTQTFTVPITNDAAPESIETVLLSLSNPRTNNPADVGRVALGSPSTATLNITDNDKAGTLALNASAYTISETGGTLHVTVTRTGGAAGGVSVDYQLSDGTATFPADFAVAVTSLSTGTVTFGAGETSKTIDIAIVNNGNADGPRTFTVALQNPPTGGAILGPPSQATVTIQDDEQTVRFASPGYSVLENRGPAQIVIERLGTPTGTLLVDFATLDGTATSTAPTADYTAVNRVLTFGPNIRSLTVPITIVNDTIVEGNETLSLRLSNPRFVVPGPPVAIASGNCASFVGGVCTVSLAIIDDDRGGEIQFMSATYAVAEGTLNASIILTRTGGLGGPVSVDFATLDGQGTAVAGADYVSTSRTVTFPANSTTQTVLIPIMNDTLDEPAETVKMRLSNPAGGAVLGARDTATLTITDNDVAGMIQFSAALYTVNESATAASIVISRTGGTASGVTIDFTTSDGPGLSGAVAGVDYTAATTTVTFGTGELSKTVLVTLPGDDVAAEGNRNVVLTLSNPGGGATLGARSTATLKILDDEPTVQFATATYSVAEGSAATITLERTGPPGIVVVQYATSNGTGTAGVDYVPKTGTVTFASTAKTATFSVPTIANSIVDGPRTVNLSLGPVTTGTAAVGPQGTAILQINDNDLGGALHFTASGYSVKEAFGIITLSVRRDGGLAGPATFNYATQDGTAKAGIDYTAKSGSLTFRPGEFFAQFSVPVIPNTRDDGDRTFNVVLSSPTGGMTLGSPSTAAVTIKEDDDGGIVQFTAPVFTVSECAAAPCSAVLTLQRSNIASNVSVDYATVDGTASALSDYVATTGTVSFAAGQLSQRITIPLQIEPGAQPTKSFGVVLSNIRGGATLGGFANAEVRIVDTK